MLYNKYKTGEFKRRNWQPLSVRKLASLSRQQTFTESAPFGSSEGVQINPADLQGILHNQNAYSN